MIGLGSKIVVSNYGPPKQSINGQTIEYQFLRVRYAYENYCRD